MTGFLVVTRNEYRWESSEFVDFSTEIRKLVLGLNQQLREVWKNSREVVDSIVNPFVEIRDRNNPFSRSADTLSTMGILKDAEDAGAVLAKLNKQRRPELEKGEMRIDSIIAKGKEEIILADDSSMKVIIDSKIGPERTFAKQREAKTNRIIVRISPQIFSPNEVTFLGKTFDVYYVAGEESSPGMSIDNEGHKIYINPFNQDISRYSVSFLEVYIATELADMYSVSKG